MRSGLTRLARVKRQRDTGEGKHASGLGGRFLL
jgi:hypothetical protein